MVTISDKINNTTRYCAHMCCQIFIEHGLKIVFPNHITNCPKCPLRNGGFLSVCMRTLCTFNWFNIQVIGSTEFNPSLWKFYRWQWFSQLYDFLYFQICRSSSRNETYIKCSNACDKAIIFGFSRCHAIAHLMLHLYVDVCARAYAIAWQQLMWERMNCGVNN